MGLSAVHSGDDRGGDGPRGDDVLHLLGLTLLKKKLDLRSRRLGNPAMKMPMMGMHMAMPNLVSAVPGVDAAATAMMKNLIKSKGVASIEELRQGASRPTSR